MSENKNIYGDPVQAMLDKKQVVSGDNQRASSADTSGFDHGMFDGLLDAEDSQVPNSTNLIVVDSGALAEQSELLPDKNAASATARAPLGEILIERGLISRDQLDVALKVQRDNGGNLMIGSALVELGFITESSLGAVLTENTNIKQFDPKAYIIDSNLVKQIPKDVAQRFSAVPILLEGNNVYVAMMDIYNVLALDYIQRYFPKRFKMVPIHCTPADLSDIIDNYYDYELSINGILKEIEALQKDELRSVTTDNDTYTNPTVRLVDALLLDAIRLGASDLHFEPEDTFVRLRYRIDGQLHVIRSLHRDYWSSIAVRIKIISSISITESRIPQDGRINMNVLGRQIDFRVATQPTIHGENIVMRILDKAKALLPMDYLGFSEKNVQFLQKALKRPEGIIVVTGPTGSGKTTTLYSILNDINSSDVNIMTLEDPVEYQLPMIRQSNIRSGTGMDFVGGIKSIMRQDPDIIFIGEIRDNDTANMAMRAAMTGHLVFTTLHTNDALGVIPRLVDIGVNPKMLSGSIIACVAQRLARRLCNACKKLEPATKIEIKVLDLDENSDPQVFHRIGCEKCSNTGYKGRVAISEIILVDDKLDELIAEDAIRAEMQRYINGTDFIPMVDDGIMKVMRGQLDVDELIRTINITHRL